jgi:osmotically-inducible protein OsmY
MHNMKHYIALLLVCSSLNLAACVPLAAVTGGAVGLGAAEERSIGDNFDDRSISAEINQHFAQSEVDDLLTDVQVRVHESRVLLTGRTDRADVALEAVRLAWAAGGVREVINEIKVGAEGTDILNYAQDNLLETQIETRLLATKNIRSLNYTVEVIDGVAYMLGVAQNEHERKSAAAVASVTKGVHKVVSYVRLKDDPKRLEKTGKMRVRNENITTE